MERLNEFSEILAPIYTNQLVKSSDCSRDVVFHGPVFCLTADNDVLNDLNLVSL